MVNLLQRIPTLRPFASLSQLSAQPRPLTPTWTSWTWASSLSVHQNSMERSSTRNSSHVPSKLNNKRNHRGKFTWNDMDAKGYQGRGNEGEVEGKVNKNVTTRVQRRDLNEEETAEFSGTHHNRKISSSVFYNSSFENFASLPPKMMKDKRQGAGNWRQQKRQTPNKYRSKQQGSQQSQNPQFVNTENEKNKGILTETQTKEGTPRILQVERPQEIIQIIPPQQAQSLLPIHQFLPIPPLPQNPISYSYGDIPPFHVSPHPMHNSYQWGPRQFINQPIPLFNPWVQQQQQQQQSFPNYPIPAVQVAVPMWGHQQQVFRPIRQPMQANMQQHQQTRGISTDVVFTRHWEEIDSVIDQQPLDFQFTVMGYNVLSPNIQLIHPEMYISHDPRAMRWDYRYACFLKEVETYNPDIVCLQEVDSAKFEKYNDFFFQKGYNGVYKKRTGTDKSDGCAIFYRDNKFKLVDMISVEYNQSSSETPLLNRDNVALLAKFCTKQELPQTFVVATTHLLFNPKRMDVKLGQTKLLLAELDRISCYGLSKEGHPLYHPTIVTGDFNAKPSSIVTQLMKSGYIHSTQIPPDRKNKYQDDPSQPRILLPKNLGISDQCQHYRVLQRRTIHLNDIHSNVSNSLVHLTHSDRKGNKHNFDEAIKKIVDDFGLKCSFGSGEISHRFHFQEVYDFNNEDESKDSVTTFQNEWVLVDYMYFSTKPNNDLKVGEEDNLKLLRRLKLPTRQECNRLGMIPREGVSSDHYHLMAEFLLRPTLLFGNFGPN